MVKIRLLCEEEPFRVTDSAIELTMKLSQAKQPDSDGLVFVVCEDATEVVFDIGTFGYIISRPDAPLKAVK
jgi:hypothetical protein